MEVRCARDGFVYLVGVEADDWHLPDHPPKFGVVLDIRNREPYYWPLREGSRVDKRLALVLVRHKAELNELSTLEASWRGTWESCRDAKEARADLEAALARLDLDRQTYPAGSPRSDALQAVISEIPRKWLPEMAERKERKEREAAAREQFQDTQCAFESAHKRLVHFEEYAIRGRVVKLLVQPGQAVRAGDVILHIEVDGER
jgi:biotin carboxyl carrier protein